MVYMDELKYFRRLHVIMDSVNQDWVVTEEEMKLVSSSPGLWRAADTSIVG